MSRIQGRPIATNFGIINKSLLIDFAFFKHFKNITLIKANGTEISIKRRNNKLYLRGTIPPKPGKEAKGHHQQEIALGLMANEENLLMAKDEAIAVFSLLKANRFDWTVYGIKDVYFSFSPSATI